MTDLRHPDEDQLMELALGHAPEPERHQATAHLAICARCRREYGDLADAVQLVLPAVPRTSPPAGFESEVLDALARSREGSQKAAGETVSPREAAARRRPGPEGAERRKPVPDHDRRRRRVRPAVAAGLVGLAVGAGVTAGVTDREEMIPVASNQWETPLVDSDGAAVGAVAEGRDIEGAVLVVRIDDGPVGYQYTCRLVLADGSTQDVAEWQLDADSPSRWVVPMPDDGVEAVEMIAGDGTVWATAEF